MKRMLWVDLEMSGLDISKDVILEAASIVTDVELNKLEEFHAVVYQPKEILESMDPWCIEHHGRSGLTAACAEGTPLEEVETSLLEQVDRHWKKKQQVVLCGNSIGTDRQFLVRWMPRLAGRLHYRILDVSSFKVILKARHGISFEKAESHRAVQDIEESIAELSHYLSFFKAPSAEI